MGCYCVQSKQYPVPRLDLNQISIDSNCGNDEVRSPDLTRYIEKYGKDGWIASLRDDRPVVRRTEEDQYLSVSNERIEQHSEWRVKDIVYLYYCQLHSRHNASRIDLLSVSYEERDAKIAHILKEIKTPP